MHIITQLGEPAESSSGVTVQSTALRLRGGRRRADPALLDRPRLADRSPAQMRFARTTHRRARCTEAFAVTEAGLLGDGKCSVSWYHEQDLEEICADIARDTKSQFCSDGRHFTSAGGLRDEVSEELARKGASILLIPYEAPTSRRGA
ncbi:type 1 glutamine amidotransferase family protein [Pseudaminobacter sp. NGMCC 1.201702]|uniref:hypothetical protein n=1 Tax=Pseudaminobacter sp. NGMCC 1.201702 TaxID=3391825 RepID=UPI0039F0903D